MSSPSDNVQAKGRPNSVIPIDDSEAGPETPLLRPSSEEYASASEKWRLVDYLKFGLLLIGDLTANIDGIFLLIVYDQISTQFDRASYGPWLITAETLACCISLPIYGLLGDNFGPYRPLLLAYALFLFGCCISATGNNFWQIVVGRVFSGIAEAGLTSMATVIISEGASPTEAGILRNYANMFSVLGRVIGSLAGGIMSDRIGWRGVFWTEAGLAALCGTGVTLMFRHQIAHTFKPGPDAAQSGSKFDYTGLTLFSFALTALLLAIDRVDKAKNLQDPFMIVCAVLTVSFGVVFALVERRAGNDAFFPVSFLKKGPVLCLMFILLFMTSSFAITTITPAYFRRTMEASSMTVSIVMALRPFGSVVGTLIAGQLIRRSKQWKVACVTGLAMCIIGNLSLTFLWNGPLPVWKWFLVLPVSLGAGFVTTSQFVALSASDIKGRSATLIGMYFLALNIGIMLGISVSATVSRLVFKQKLWEQLSGLPNRHKVKF